MAQETILVIDDGKDNRDFLLEHVLTPNGYKGLMAKDGQEGLQMAMKHRPDLILLDLQMPRMDGIQVLKHMARQKLDIPVILMTFHGSEEIAIEVYRLGVKDYVKKPYYADEMVEAIERALTETRLRREKEALTERVMQANRKLQQRLQELNILYNVGKHVTSITDLQVLLPRIVDAATQITQADEGQLCLIEDRAIVCRAHKDPGMEHARAVQADVNDRIIHHVLKTRKALAISPDQMEETSEGRASSLAYAPLILKKRVLGVLGVARHNSGQAFTQNDGALLNALSDYAAIAIENSRNYMALQESKEQLRDTFERFVPPSVVQQAIARPEGVQLGGMRQEISVLFADISGYTSWSENATPEQVIETLNHYLSLAASVILGWEGTLDKFMGDGMMAIFNAPDPQEDHVHRAADAALAIMRAAQEVNLQHGYQLTFSIGVNVGEAVVGYIGTQRALNYTAIGDTVNLAKRLEESAEPGQIIVDEEIVRRLGDRVKVRPLGEIRVKGRKSGTQAYELIDLFY